MTLVEHELGPTTSLPIIETYPTLRGLQLHSLAYSLSYRCARCEQRRDSTMIAITESYAPVCPACYADRLRPAG